MRNIFSSALLSLWTISSCIAQVNPTDLLDRMLLNPEYKIESEVIVQKRLEGMSDPLVLDLIETNYSKPRRKAAIQLQKKGDALPGGSAAKGFYPASSCNDNDIGVELGNFATWQGQTSCWYATVAGGSCSNLPWSTVSLPLAGRITTVPMPTSDPCASVPGFPIALPSPTGGSFSVKLGNNLSNAESERISHQFVVQPQDVNFTYQYALVFDDPGHAPSDQPFFDFVILGQNGDTVPCSFQHYTAGGAIPGFQTSSNPVGCGGLASVQYKPWATAGVNLSNYIGQQVTVVCTTGDCALCGHWGYAYVDFSCGGTPLSAGCSGAPVTICAPNEPGATYQWSTGQTTACLNVTPNPGDTYTVTVSPPSGCGYSLHYAAGNSNVQALFTYSLTANTVNFSNLSTGASVYSWNFGDGSPGSSLQDPVHTYPGPGTYSACLTAGVSPCTSQVCKVITITTTPGAVNENDLLSWISVSPNPASENIFLDFNGQNFGEAEIVFTNVIGEKLFTALISASGKQTLDVSKFPEGVYFVRIETNAGISTRKAIISR